MGILRLSEHLKCFSAAHLPVNLAADILEASLREYAETQRRSIRSLADVREFILPLKSFTTRFVIVSLDGWSVIFSDMRNEDCAADAMLLSDKGICKAVSICYQDLRRKFKMFERGKTLWHVETLKDGGPWQSWEDREIPLNMIPPVRGRKGKQLLSVEGAIAYFEHFTGLPLPKWTDDYFKSAVGLERSTGGLLSPVIRFDTIDDLDSNNGQRRS